MKIKHKCEICAEWSAWFNEMSRVSNEESKESAKESKEYTKRSREYANRCLCEKKQNEKKKGSYLG